MQVEERTAEIFVDGFWVPVNKEDIVAEDIFRLIEPDGTYVVGITKSGEEVTEFTAASDAQYDEEHGTYIVVR